MNYLHIIPCDIYTQIYKYVYNDCMREVVSSYNDKRNNKFKDKYLAYIVNDENRIYYTCHLDCHHFLRACRASLSAGEVRARTHRAGAGKTGATQLRLVGARQ